MYLIMHTSLISLAGFHEGAEGHEIKNTWTNSNYTDYNFAA